MEIGKAEAIAMLKALGIFAAALVGFILLAFLIVLTRGYILLLVGFGALSVMFIRTLYLHFMRKG